MLERRFDDDTDFVVANRYRQDLDPFLLGDAAPGLTPRQRAIVGLIVRGLADKQIAKALGVTRRTVRTQLERMYRRHGIHSKPEAVALLIRTVGDDHRQDRPPLN